LRTLSNRFFQVQRHGQAKKYMARVAPVAHDADLVLLSVDDPDFFTGITPLPLGPLPEVQTAVTVYGFPEGGDTLSMTAGVLSRVEQTAYVHSNRWLLGAPLDAAINSGNNQSSVDGRLSGFLARRNRRFLFKCARWSTPYCCPVRIWKKDSVRAHCRPC
jgi:hypothetical protein